MIKNRNSTLTFSLIALLCLLSGPAFAKVESSYGYWGLGYANITYPNKLSKNIKKEDFKNKQLKIHVGGVSYDVALRYLPLPVSKRTYAGKHTVIGIIGNGAVDTYADDEGDSIVIINHSLFSLSSMHFFGSEIGSGPFVRADVGLSWLYISDITGETVPDKSELGFGYLLGGGIAFTKTLLNINYSSRKIDDEDYKILAISIGWLH